MSSGILQSARPLKLDRACVGAASSWAWRAVSTGGQQQPPQNGHSPPISRGPPQAAPLLWVRRWRVARRR